VNSEAVGGRAAAGGLRRKAKAPPANALARLGRAIKAGWLKFAALLAKVNGAILLTIIYFLIIAPINLVTRVMRTDLLGKRIGDEPSFWEDPEGPSRSIEESRRQF
jgi:hypothetical protein